MTLDGFLSEIEKLDIKWQDNYGTIRSVNGLSPICQLAKHKGYNWTNAQWANAGKDIGLSVEDTTSIVYASDSLQLSPKLRQKLIQIILPTRIN